MYKIIVAAAIVTMGRQKETLKNYKRKENNLGISNNNTDVSKHLIKIPDH